MFSQLFSLINYLLKISVKKLTHLTIHSKKLLNSKELTFDDKLLILNSANKKMFNIKWLFWNVFYSSIILSNTLITKDIG